MAKPTGNWGLIREHKKWYLAQKMSVHQSSPVIVDYQIGVHVVYTWTQIFLQGQELAHKIKITTATYCRLSQCHTKETKKHIIQNKKILRI